MPCMKDRYVQTKLTSTSGAPAEWELLDLELSVHHLRAAHFSDVRRSKTLAADHLSLPAHSNAIQELLTMVTPDLYSLAHPAFVLQHSVPTGKRID
eukprot:1302223-Amphidinium_carterae.1